MKRFIGAMKAGLKGAAEAMGPGSYSAAGIKITCPHCKNDTFERQEALLNTRGSTLVNLDWLDKSGTALICTRCSLIQWFGEEPGRK
jgi:hypothetical protein